MGDSLWAALALVLVLEGLLPLLWPRGWRQTFQNLLQLRDGQLRANLGHATSTIRAKRAAVVGEVPDWAELRAAGAAIIRAEAGMSFFSRSACCTFGSARTAIASSSSSGTVRNQSTYR